MNQHSPSFPEGKGCFVDFWEFSVFLGKIGEPPSYRSSLTMAGRTVKVQAMQYRQHEEDSADFSANRGKQGRKNRTDA
jgi:hypothetical protein